MKNNNIYNFICPVCDAPLERVGGAFGCSGGHSFDIAKEGYVNLLTGSRSGALTGDSADMARCRRAFLSKGCFDVLSNELCRIAEKYGVKDSVLDICCGEGHYSSFFKDHIPESNVLGFDLSREMVKRAAKQNKNVGYAVANMTSIPVPDGSVDFAFHLFAPFCASEFMRILSPNGILVSVVAGTDHLIELKELLYDKPYLNDVRDPSDGESQIVEEYDLKDKINLRSNEDIRALFNMTPYCHHTPPSGMQKLARADSLDVSLCFHIFIFGKRERLKNEL